MVGVLGVMTGLPLVSLGAYQSHHVIPSETEEWYQTRLGTEECHLHMKNYGSISRLRPLGAKDPSWYIQLVSFLEMRVCLFPPLQ